jgi:serine/threonine protein kinase
VYKVTPYLSSIGCWTWLHGKCFKFAFLPFQGTLRDGTAVAVKVLSLQSRQGAKEFLSELLAISDISHENLVKLHGCCVEGSHKILVYNYLENNSLAQTLLGSFSLLIPLYSFAPEE